MTTASTCEKNNEEEVLMPSENEPELLGQGSAYIGCEVEPFYVDLSTLSVCSTDLPVDSFLSATWQFGCTMNLLTVDSMQADFQFSYLQPDSLSVAPYDTDITLSQQEFIVNGESLVLNEYPYYGSFTVIRGDTNFQFLLMNRYIGGCFHDELIWKITY